MAEKMEQEGIAQALKRALLLDHSDDAYMDETDDVSSFLIDGRIDLNFIAAQLEPLLVNAKAAGRQQGLAMAAEALKPFARCANELDYEDKVRSEYSDEPFVTPDDEWAKFRLLASDYRRARNVLAAITALLSEKPA